jgi:hypothetical protein
MNYGASHIYPWENRISDSESFVDFAYVADYVYDPEKGMGEKVMPYLRMSLNTPESFNTVVLTERGARQIIEELTEWLDQPKRQPRRGKRVR